MIIFKSFWKWIYKKWFRKDGISVLILEVPVESYQALIQLQVLSESINPSEVLNRALFTYHYLKHQEMLGKRFLLAPSDEEPEDTPFIVVEIP